MKFYVFVIAFILAFATPLVASGAEGVGGTCPLSNHLTDNTNPDTQADAKDKEDEAEETETAQ